MSRKQSKFLAKSLARSLGFYVATLAMTSFLTGSAHASWFDKKTDTPAKSQASASAATPAASAPVVTVPTAPAAPPPPPLGPGAPVVANFGEVKDGAVSWMVIGTPVTGAETQAQCVASRNATQPGATPDLIANFIRVRGSTLPNLPPVDKLQFAFTSTTVPEKSAIGLMVDEKKADVQVTSRSYMRNASFDIADLKTFEASLKKAKKTVLQFDDSKLEFQASVLAELTDKLDGCVAEQEKKIAKAAEDAKKAAASAAKK